VQAVTLSNDSKQILCTYGGNNVPIGATIFDMVDVHISTRFNGHSHSPICAKFLPDGQTAVTGDSDCYIYMWNTSTGKVIHRMSGKGKCMQAGGWSPDGQAIAYGQIQINAVLLKPL